MPQKVPAPYRQFSVGDAVIIKRLPPDSTHFYPGTSRIEMRYTDKMHMYAGQQATIASVHPNKYGNVYQIDIDDELWYWTDDFFIPLIMNNEKAKSLLSQEPL